MYSKQLLLQQKIPQLPARRADAVYRAQDISYLVKSRLAMHGRLLIAAFYSRESAANGFSLPFAVLFQTKQEYITLLNGPDGHKWKASRITHALGFDYYNKSQVIGLTVKDEARIRSFLSLVRKEEEPALDIHRHIEAYQDILLEKRLTAKKERTAARIDKRMKDIPKLPDAFARWVDSEPLLHSRYIFYRRVTKRKAEGFCSHCKKDLIITAEIPAHNEKSTCPSCRSAITYKAIGRSKKVWDEDHAAILQKTCGSKEYILRYFSVSRSFIRDYRNPEDSYSEKARLFFTADGAIAGQYKYGWSAKTGRYGWYASNNIITGKNKDISWLVNLGMYVSVKNVWFRPAYLYQYNLRPMLTGLNLSYDISKNIKGRAVDVTTYLMRSMIYPFAPSLWRIGLPRLGGDLLEECYEPDIYRPSGALHTRFGVTKAFMGFMREHNLGMEAVKLRAGFAKEPDGDDFLWMLENKIDGKDVAILRLFASSHKIRKYIQKQMKACRVHVWGNDTEAKRLMVFWKDYLSMCQKLGYDLTKKSILFPKNIQHEHDKVQQLIRIQHDPVMDEKIKMIYPELNRTFSYADGEYMIRPPKDFDDFINEGVNLLHCVCASGYYRGHVERTSYIFFLRRSKKPDVPFYTIEYQTDSGRIRQCQGYRHKNQNAEIKAFTEKWQTYLLGQQAIPKAA